MDRPRKICFRVLLAILVFVLGLLYIPRLLGYHVFTVVSESMEPTLYRGDIVFGSPIDKLSEVSEGDVIVYTTSNKELQRIIHRVVYKNSYGVYTLGDNNIKKDALVKEEQLLSKVDYKIPLMGYLVLVFVEHKMLIIVGSAFLAFLSVTGKVGKDEEADSEISESSTEGREEI